MDFMRLANERFSVRSFLNKPVEPEKIDIILRAGQVAPTACNKQPQRIYVIQSEEALKKLQNCKMSHFGETLALLVCVDTRECWERDYDGKNSGDIDGAIVTTHMMLSAWELGIGSTWIMHFIPEAIRCEFDIPEYEEPVSLLVMGYAADDAEPAVFHTQTRDLKEMVTVL